MTLMMAFCLKHLILATTVSRLEKNHCGNTAPDTWMLFLGFIDIDFL
jgi:hypothetical protein